MAKSPNERIAALREKIAKKQTAIEGYSKTLANTQKNIDAANKAIEGYGKQISALEADILAKVLHKKGINISEIAAAIEAGLYNNSIPEKPPDMSEKEPETTDKDGATGCCGEFAQSAARTPRIQGELSAICITENTVAENISGLHEKEDLSNE